jgi:hypothetical protein
MKLSVLHENNSSIELFKGVSIWSGYKDYKHEIGATGVNTPGFLSPLHIARVYSEPKLTGSPNDPSIIITVAISQSEIEDLSDEFREWCDARSQEYDVSLGFPTEWRDRIWTVRDGGSAHRTGVRCFGFCEFVYCGVPKSYTVVRHYRNQHAWEQDTPSRPSI